MTYDVKCHDLAKVWLQHSGNDHDATYHLKGYDARPNIRRA